MREQPPPITARTTVHALAEHPLADALTPLELLVYLRLVASSGADGVSDATNNELKPGYVNDPRPIVRALRSLAERGLVKINYPSGGTSFGRSITVVR